MEDQEEREGDERGRKNDNHTDLGNLYGLKASREEGSSCLEKRRSSLKKERKKAG